MYTSQPHLPRILGTKPAGITQHSSGWPAQLGGDQDRRFLTPPSHRTISLGHSLPWWHVHAPDLTQGININGNFLQEATILFTIFVHYIPLQQRFSLQPPPKLGGHAEHGRPCLYGACPHQLPLGKKGNKIMINVVTDKMAHTDLSHHANYDRSVQLCLSSASSVAS